VTAILWTQVSGPTTAIFGTPTLAATSVSNLTAAGSYIFRIKVTDNSGDTAVSNTTVTVNPNPVPFTPQVKLGGYPTFVNPSKDSVGVLRNVGSGVGAYGKARVNELDTAGIVTWLGSRLGGAADGNNYTASTTFSGVTLTTVRNGLSNLTAAIDTATMATKAGGLKPVNDSALVLRTLSGTKVNYTDTASMLSPYLRSAAAGATYATIATAGQKVAYTDTASMLTPYLRSAAAGATYATIATVNGRRPPLCPART
jgi:hypothetical protein